MVYQISVLYHSENISFDLNYYLSVHMPLVSKNWKSYGLQKWEVARFDDRLNSKRPNYSAEATLTFDNLEQVHKALASDAAKVVFADIPNFTDVQPVILGGDVVGGETL